MASLMARGAYSNTGTSAGIAHSAAPRACPSFNALSTLRLTNTRSTATSDGPCSDSSARNPSKISRSRAAGVADATFRQPCATGSSSLRERLEQQPVPPDESDSVPPEAVADLCRRILDFVEQTSEPNTWQAFRRLVVEEQPTADVAAALGMTENAVRGAKSRVLRRVREEFGDLLG